MASAMSRVNENTFSSPIATSTAREMPASDDFMTIRATRCPAFAEPKSMTSQLLIEEDEPASREMLTIAVSEDAAAGDIGAASAGPQDLKQATARGALASTGARVITLLLRTGSMMILARLLLPEEFGLVGMAAVVTGFLAWFKDAGLSMATVQQASITRAQTSTLFWINFAVGGMLALLCTAIAPVLVAFYGEPRLLWLTVALGASFIFNGASAQHQAMLQRNMRFVVLSIIEIISLSLSIVLGIGLAAAGWGYWALVAMAVSQPAVSLMGLWLAGGWIPGMPRQWAAVSSMIRFGGTVTLNNFIVYFAFNAEKMLLGRFWGAEALGIYGRAYQLINLPIENLNSTIGWLVAFPTLSRVQNDTSRLRLYFLKAYSLFLSLVIPITTACVLFAEDMILVFLGPRWHEAASVFRLLAPTIMALALIHPLGWLLMASGRTGRSLKIALLIAPVVILGYLLGLSHGPKGVAAGYSASMALLVVPVVLWSIRGTSITFRDILNAAVHPLLSTVVAAAAALAIRGVVDQLQQVLLRLGVDVAVLFGVYLIMLLFVMGQKSIYFGLLRNTGLWRAGNRRLEQQKGSPV